MISSNHSYLIIIISSKQVIIFYAKNLLLDQVFLFNTSNQFLLVFQNVKSCWIILYLSWFILTNIHTYIHTGRVFANGLGDRGSIPGQVIPKTLKMVLDTSLLNTRHYKVWSNPGKGVVPSLTPWCSSYWKGSLQVTLNYGGQQQLIARIILILQKYWFWGYLKW